MTNISKQWFYAFSLIALVLIMSLISLTSIASQTEQLSKQNLDLGQYQVVHQQTLDFIDDNLSGITYSRDTDTLFAIINNPEQIVELDKNGQLLRRMKLHGFIDTEGITYIGQQQFAISQERQRSVSIVNITGETQALNAQDYKQFSLSSQSQNNLGLEGIAWAPDVGLFVSNEKSPSEVIRIPMALFTGIQQQTKDYGDIMPKYYKNLPVTDISGLHFYKQTQQLFVLSDESRQLLLINDDGEIQSQFNFDPWLFGIGRDVEQPEGITMDEQGHIYIVGEPNVLLVMSPSS